MYKLGDRNSLLETRVFFPLFFIHARESQCQHGSNLVALRHVISRERSIYSGILPPVPCDKKHFTVISPFLLKSSHEDIVTPHSNHLEQSRAVEDPSDTLLTYTSCYFWH